MNDIILVDVNCVVIADIHVIHRRPGLWMIPIAKEHCRFCGGLIPRNNIHHYHLRSASIVKSQFY
jgi:hypothetical protein